MMLRRPDRPRLHRVTTRDGWKIALHHYAQRPPGDAIDTVILCHGLSSNRFDLDAPGERSIARFLHEHGWDVWVLELRGAGRSSRPRPWNRHRFDWNFDDYLYHDVPAAIRYVRRVTGRDRVHWVGHSMGGMLGYAFLATQGNDWAASMVTIGSPSMRAVHQPLLDAIVPMRGLLKYIGRIPQGRLGSALSPLLARTLRWTGHLIVNPDNLAPSEASRLMRCALEDIPASLVKQLADWYAGSNMVNHYGFVSYSESLRQITAPLYVIAGTADQLTPAGDLRGVYESVGSTDKRYSAFGRDSGCRHDYGHIDLVLGDHAREEVWPHVLGWLNEHAQAHPGAATTASTRAGSSDGPAHPRVVRRRREVSA